MEPGIRVDAARGDARVYLDESGDVGQALFVSDGSASWTAGRKGGQEVDEVQWFTALPRVVGGCERVRRLKRPELPIRASREEAQADLDRYASSHGLKRCCRRCRFTADFVELGAGGWGASGELCGLCEEDVARGDARRSQESGDRSQETGGGMGGDE